MSTATLFFLMSALCAAVVDSVVGVHMGAGKFAWSLSILSGFLVPGAAFHTAGGWWDPREEAFLVQRRRRSKLVLEQNETIGAALDDYMEFAQQNKQVQGYLELQALMTFRVLAASQLEIGVYGGVAEIGVHHGMSFAPLCLLNADAGAHQSIAVAVDVFELQHLNTDGSGGGDRHIFESTTLQLPALLLKSSSLRLHCHTLESVLIDR
mmetsp:Transcript_52666/g.85216  ORF Transcript_52666/g.85216 Transcript_52666/m.85216 type:complete len:209 (+) Transcript_52666:104-730(+)